MSQALLKAWIVDRLSQAKFQEIKGLHYYLAFVTWIMWSGFKGA